MRNALELCWGTVPGATLAELAGLAARHGFRAITIRSEQWRAARDGGQDDHAIRQMLDELGVSVAIIDPLISVLPGTPKPEDVAPEHRKYFTFTEADCLDAALALGARTVNLAHFLGSAVPVAQLAEAAGGVAGRLAAHGLGVTVEFIPGTGIPDFGMAAEIVRLAGAPNLGIMFDTWHFARSGGTVATLKALPPGIIRGLQLSDREAPPPGEPYVPMSGRLPPGEGELPLVDILRAILPANPGLAVGVEVFSSEVTDADAWVGQVSAATRAVLGRVSDPLAPTGRGLG